MATLGSTNRYQNDRRHGVGRRQALLQLGSTGAALAVAAGTSIRFASAGQQVSQAQLDQLIADWPAKPKEVAQQMIGKYGPPQEATAHRLFWRQNGPWQESILTRGAIVGGAYRPVRSADVATRVERRPWAA